MNFSIDSQERSPSWPNSHTSEKRTGIITNNLLVYKPDKNNLNFANIEGYYSNWDQSYETGSKEIRFNVEPMRPGDHAIIRNISGNLYYAKTREINKSVVVNVKEPRKKLTLLVMRKHNYSIALFELDLNKLFRVLIFKDQNLEHVSHHADRIELNWINGYALE